MIYTVTFNPAVDYIMHTGTLKSGTTNRAKREAVYFGGKGINVSLVLKELKIRSKALGFVAGFTGEAIEGYLAKEGVETDFVQLQNGFSRINVKIKGESETEINGAGPDIPEDALEAFFKKTEALQDGDTLILAGSIPKSLPGDIYAEILKRLQNKNIRIVADAAGELLRSVLPYRPFLIKPNRQELGELFKKETGTVEEVTKYAHQLQQMGAVNVLVSLAGDGAVLLDADGRVHVCAACRGEAVNSVGAGDSMVAGFLAGCESGDYEYALKLGTAAGGATAFSAGLAKKKDIENCLRQLCAEASS